MQNSLKFGLLSGAFSILLTLLLWATGLHSGDLSIATYLGYFGMLVSVAFLVLAVYFTRKNELEGFITFGRAW